MKEQVIRSIGLVVSAAVLGGCLVWFFKPVPKPSDEGEWKSTGDGKTIVNSKTGELRLTRNGMNVEDAEDLAQRQASLIAQKEDAERKNRETSERFRQEAARIQAINERRITDARRSQEQADDALIRSANRGVYMKAKAFIESQNAKGFPSTVPYFNQTWHRYTAGILAGQPINSSTLHSLKTLVLEIQTYERIRVDKLQRDAKEEGVSLPVLAVFRGQSLDKACESEEWADFLVVLDAAEFTKSVTSIEPGGFVAESDIVEAERLRK